MDKESRFENFKSTNKDLNSFKLFPVSEWSYQTYKEYFLNHKTRAPRMSLFSTKYRLSLHLLLNMSGISTDIKAKARLLLENFNKEHEQKQQQKQPPPPPQQQQRTYANYETVGVQGDLNGGEVQVLREKRERDEPDESFAEFPTTHQRQRKRFLLNFLKLYHKKKIEIPAHAVPLTGLLVACSRHPIMEIYRRRKYMLVLNEFAKNYFNISNMVYSMDAELSLDERLLLSSIKYTDTCPIKRMLQPRVFSDDVYAEIRKWRRSRVTKTLFFPRQVTPHDPPTEDDIFQRDLSVFLCSLSETLDRKTMKNSKQSEIDFIVENVSIILKFVFSSRSKANIMWEKGSETAEDGAEIKITHDFLIYNEEQELGCGEIKVNNSSRKLKDEDRARLGERLKKQLHSRIRQAKSKKEFSTCGIFISDSDLELYQCMFSKKDGYVFSLLNKMILPTLKSTYNSLEESLKLLFSFKERIISSIQDASDCEKSYIYQDYVHYSRPTTSLI